MKKILIKIFLLAGIITVSNILYAQEDDLLNPSALVRSYQLNMPNDQVSIISDRDTYFSGEKVWFSLFLSDDVTGEPVIRSRIMYVELVDMSGNPLDQYTFYTDGSTLDASLTLPLEVPSGTYYIRAYHLWHKNYDPSYFGVTLIQIINAYKPPPNLKPEGESLICNYFPEGGKLIYHHDCYVVIEVKSENSIYAEIEDAFVLNSNGDTVAAIVPVSKGIGHFQFTPEKNNEYLISVKGCRETILNIDEFGASLKVEESESGYWISWEGSDDYDQFPAYLIGMYQGNLLFSNNLDKNDHSGRYNLEKSRLRNGLHNFLLLDKNLEMLASRTVFNVHTAETERISISTEKNEFGKRDQVKINLTSDPKIEFMYASISVFKDLFSRPDDILHSYEASIYLHQHLNDWDDFRQMRLDKGQMESGNIIDDYLLTKQLNRHAWSQIRNQSPDIFNHGAEKNFQLITGKALKREDGNPLRNEELQMFFMDENPYLLKATTDEDGKFIFRQPVGNYAKQIVQIQPKHSVSPISSSIDYSYHNAYHPYKLNYFYFDSSRVEEFDRAFVNWQINMLYDGRINLDGMAEPWKERVSFYEDAKNRFVLDDYISFLDMEEVFKEIIYYAHIKGRKGSRFLEVHDNLNYFVIGENPLMLFNGQPVDDIEKILKIPEKEVKFIDVIPRRYYIGDIAWDGIVNVVTWNKQWQFDVPKNNYRTVLELMDPKIVNRNLNFPNAELEDGNPDRLPDLRNTLYWNPDVVFQEGIANLAFTSGDDTGNYVIVFRGMTKEGEVVESRKKFRVANP